MTIEIDWGDEHQEPSKLPLNIAHALGGGLAGLAQGGSEIGRNIAQFPFDAYSYFTGNPAFQTPQPGEGEILGFPQKSFKELAPQSNVGQMFEKGGEFAAPFVGSPALAAEMGLAKAPLLMRLLRGAGLGAAESENRKLGAGLGALAPAAGKGIKFIKETPFTQRAAVKKLEKAKELAGTESHGIPMSLDFLRNMEYQMQSPHLKPVKMQINTLMGNAAKGDYPAYFELQSALGDIERELLHPQSSSGKGFMAMLSKLLNKPETSASERLTGRQLNQIRSQYVKDAMEHLTKTGKGKIAQLESKGKQEYSNYKNFLPLRNKLLLGGLATSVPGINYLKHILNHD